MLTLGAAILAGAGVVALGAGYWFVNRPVSVGAETHPPLAELTRSGRPNDALAATPAAVTLDRTVDLPGFEVPPDAVLDRLAAAVAALPRTERLARDADRATFVQRSATVGFPDLVTVYATRTDDGRTGAVIWSRSVYGHSDFGVNAARVRSLASRLAEAD